MIFVARLISLIGAAVVFGGLWTLFVMLGLSEVLPSNLLDYWGFILSATCLGGVLLIIGQKAGNDLFKLRGRDSLFSLRFSRNNSGTWWHHSSNDFDGGGDFGD